MFYQSEIGFAVSDGMLCVCVRACFFVRVCMRACVCVCVCASACCLQFADLIPRYFFSISFKHNYSKGCLTLLGKCSEKTLEVSGLMD